MQLFNLKQFFRFIAIDNRGIGKSDGNIDGLKIEDMANDINILLTSLNLSNVHILGHSMGAMVALEYTLQHPENVLSLILSSMPIYYFSDNSETPEEKLKSFLEKDDKEQFNRNIISYLFSSDFKKSVKYKAMEGLLSKSNKDYRPDVILLQLNAIKEWKQLRRWEKNITVPCKVIYGAEDKFATVDPEFLSKIFPGVKIDIIEGAGHAVHIEKSKEFNELIYQFIKEQSSKES